ncbi:hypothetical protein [Mycobacterium hubeiense]|uniref:hypothetical protein n=1 Tax=Mycobacterium hubeiense TaxID=1867256 RepID=UPI000C7F4859|nr:hypothetical protein [Mycobacterium sp. QGD 101]
MAGIAEIALGAAPLAGGALLGVIAGNIKGPDVRAIIKQDMELLDKLPAEDTQRRAALQRTIDMRIDDLVHAVDRGRELREAAASYKGDWRDIVLFLCTLLFTFVWWNVKHDRPNWLIFFIFLIALTVMTALYAFRGGLRALQSFLQERRGRR